MKNKLQDLTDHLFAQIERLGDESITDPETIRTEIQRAGAITLVGREIISAGYLSLAAAKQINDFGPDARTPKLLGLDGDKQ